MGKVQHFEIPADDMKRAGEFYGNVFGWNIQDASMDDMKYHMAYTTEVDEKFMPKEVAVINGGIYQRRSKEGPTIVVTVANLNDALERVKSGGGEVVMEPKKVGDMGIYSIIKDSEGNPIGVWEAIKKM